MADHLPKAPDDAKKESGKAPSAPEAEVPDPGIDDLDELDDMLDEFSSTSIDPKKPSSSGPGRPSAPTPRTAAAGGPAPSIPPSTSNAPPASVSASAPRDDISDTDFAAQLQKEMASLMGEVDAAPEMRDRLQGVMAELNSQAAEALAPDADGTKPPAAKGADQAFQETIRRTMERMRASGEKASAEEASAAGDEAPGGEGELFAQLLQEMTSAGAGEGAGGEGGDEAFSKMLLGMMEQLTNREILYEPMRELHVKFPGWMREHEGKVPEEDVSRYKEQQRLVAEITARYEREGYRDEDEQDREYIVERMQKMQAAGNPPADLVGDMKEAQDLLGDPEGCAQQ